MWNLFNKKKKLLYPGFSWLQRDIHNHLLPGIDDGSPDVETSIALVRDLAEAGIKDFVCSPHIIQDMYRNTPETINLALDKLNEAIRKEKIDVKISAWAEYMLDEFFVETLRSGKQLQCISGKFILTELPLSVLPSNLESMAFEINTSGYHAVLAHPERYLYYHSRMESYTRLKELGFSLQLNLLSLTGYYGPRILTAAKYLLKHDLIDYVGTDLHHFDHLRMLTEKSSIRIFEKYLGGRIWNTFDEV
ncbi:MAG: histidinol phosphatase [Chitinophagaceae bacterium]|nr:histidinol phosphatase [Chitinophagaceae bacterium]